MIVARFSLFVEDLVVGCDQVTELFGAEYVVVRAFPARSPCNLGPHADLPIRFLLQLRANVVFS